MWDRRDSVVRTRDAACESNRIGPLIPLEGHGASNGRVFVSVTSKMFGFQFGFPLSQPRMVPLQKKTKRAHWEPRIHLPHHWQCGQIAMSSFLLVILEGENAAKSKAQTKGQWQGLPFLSPRGGIAQVFRKIKERELGVPPRFVSPFWLDGSLCCLTERSSIFCFCHMMTQDSREPFGCVFV